jgi:hypothetical protein
LYIYAHFKPTQLINAVANLYIHGSTELNGLTIKSIEGIQNSTARYEGNSPISLIFGGSIVDNYNLFVGFPSAEGSGNKNWAATINSTMKNWVTDLMGGEIIDTYDTESLRGSWPFVNGNDNIQRIVDFVNSGGVVAWAVDGKSYKKAIAGKDVKIGDGFESYLSHGDHWAVISGKNMSFDKQKKTITLTSFDQSNGEKTYTLSQEDFIDMTWELILINK